MADHVLVVGRGRVLADGPIGELVHREPTSVRLCSPQLPVLAEALREAGAHLEYDGSAGDGGQETAMVTGLSSGRIGDLAAEHGCSIHELTPLRPALEDIYLRLTDEAAEYRASIPVGDREVTSSSSDRNEVFARV
ncbi:hypothetical protein [Streptomyces sp. NBC_00885]|uniref:hypothetical protein n=1 Tax=Streptomyces sp. NBC_00885 TaxID=2975857 RepID=UPI003868DEB5